MARIKKTRLSPSNSDQDTNGHELLYDEYRLVEREESDVNISWKGAHLLLFFLAFIFGSFCTFCLHMLMYMFDEQCVLFPKLLTLSTEQKKNTRRLLPRGQEKSLPVDFVSTQWAEKSVCYLPTFVPLVSSIFGMVWITMFLMCSAGSQTYTGCSIAINVVTLAYQQRRITGVYQALQMTIFSAWVHTACWVLSAALVLLRVGLAVDFQLVRVKATLVGDLDLMLQRQERQIRTVSPDPWVNNGTPVEQPDVTTYYGMDNPPPSPHPRPLRIFDDEDSHPRSVQGYQSEMSLLPEEKARIAKVMAIKKVTKDKQFIVRMVYDLVESLNLGEPMRFAPSDTDLRNISDTSALPLKRSLGQEKITSLVAEGRNSIELETAARNSIHRETKDFISASLLKQLDRLEAEKAGAAMDSPSTSILTIKGPISTHSNIFAANDLTQPSTSGWKAKKATEPQITNTDDDMVEMQDRAIQTAPKEPKVTFLEDKTTMTSDDQSDDDQTTQKPEDKDAKKKKKEKMD